MGLKGNPEFRKAVDAWAAEGLIAPEVAQALQQRYELNREPPWYQRSGFVVSALAIFFSLLGVVLVISQNWQHLGRWAQSIVGLLPLAIAHSIGMLALQRNRMERAELAFFAACCLYGVNIFLQGQIFHLPGDWPEGIFLWALGTFPFVWLLRSTLLYAGFLLLVFFWQFQDLVPNGSQYAGLLTLAGSIAVLRIRPGWPALIVLTANAAVLLFRLDAWLGNPLGESQLPVFGLLACLLAAIAAFYRMLPEAYDALFRIHMERLAEGLAILLLYLATFEAIAPEMVRYQFSWGIPIAWGLTGYLLWRKPPQQAQWLPAIVAALFTLAWGVGLSVSEKAGWLVEPLVTLLANLLFFFGALYLVWYARKVRSRRAFLTGIACLLLLTLTRYLELVKDYLTSAALFFAASTILFLTNRYWHRHLSASSSAPGGKNTQ